MSKLERYPAYKESGVEWLGEIPEGWEVKKLKFIANNKTIKSVESDFKISLENIESQTTKYIETQEIVFSEAGINFKKGDVLFGKLRPYLAKVYLAEQEGLCVSEFLVLESKNIKSIFLKYMLVSYSCIEHINSYTYGTKMPRTSWNFIGNSLVPIPPKEEQTKIASFLDKKTAQIDKAISQKEKLIELLKERRQIVINKAVTKGLDKAVEFKDSGVEWIGEIPKHWKIFPGLRVFSENKRKNTGMIDDRVLSLSYGRIIKKSKEKLVGLVPESFETYQIVKAGDIIIRCTDLQNDKVSLRTALAKDDGIITSAYLNLNVKNESSEYWHYLLHVLDITKAIYKLGSGLRQNLSFNDFKRLDIVILPKDEQLKIVEYIETQTAKIDKAIELQQNYIAKLKEYKASLIDSVVTGKVRVV